MVVGRNCRGGRCKISEHRCRPVVDRLLCVEYVSKINEGRIANICFPGAGEHHRWKMFEGGERFGELQRLRGLYTSRMDGYGD